MFESSFRRPSGGGSVGENASVALLFVALGLFGPVSAAWAKKDKVDVTLTGPAPGALYNAPAAVVLSAIAQTKQKSHSIAKVEFFQGMSPVGSVTGPRAGDQYTLSWTGVAAGTYSLTAKATNDKGDTDLSDPVSITVNALPSVSLTSPSSNVSFKAPCEHSARSPSRRYRRLHRQRRVLLRHYADHLAQPAAVQFRL